MSGTRAKDTEQRPSVCESNSHLAGVLILFPSGLEKNYAEIGPSILKYIFFSYRHSIYITTVISGGKNTHYFCESRQG